MADDPIDINVEKESFRARRAPSPRRSVSPLLLGFGVAAILVLVVVVALRRGGSTQPNADPDGRPADPIAIEEVPSQPSPANQADALATDLVVIDDDGKTQWLSPTSGPPIELTYLPPGSQWLLHLRPADLLTHMEAEKILAALGPWGEESTSQLVQLTGTQLKEMKSLTVAVAPDVSGNLEVSFRVDLLRPWSSEDIQQRFPEGQVEQREGMAISQNLGRAVFLPRDDLLVCCPPTILGDLLQQGDTEVLFPREMQRLLESTDRHRMMTLVFPPKTLQIHADKLLRDLGEPMVDALHAVIGYDASAVALSAHWDKDFFCEVQATVTLNRRPHLLASNLKKRLHTASEELESTLQNEPMHPFGRNITDRFPEMLRLMSKFSRSSEARGLSIVRCYLPLAAGHNLLMAAELVLNCPSEDSPVAMERVQQTPDTMADRLQKVTSLVFAKDTLQRALEILAEDIDIPIEIVGRDLQLEGITKNQSFALELRNRPAQEILEAILRQANPDQSATGLDDPKQKLVYVMREGQADQPDAIVVTTRAAVLRRGERLPDTFRPSQQ